MSNHGNAYRRRVESYIRENKYQLTIAKLSSNLPITSEELSFRDSTLTDGKRDKRGLYEGIRNRTHVFIRSIIGLDIMQHKTLC
jgi:type I restriction enzyme R subunit